MTMTTLDRTLVAGDAGRVTGERHERPDPEVPEKARRRTFTAQYKGIGARAACRAAGVPRANWYRRHGASPAAPKAAPVP